jgi:hypothetical protein
VEGSFSEGALGASDGFSRKEITVKAIKMYESTSGDTFRTRREALGNDLVHLLEESGVHDLDEPTVFAKGIIDNWQNVLKLMSVMPSVATLEPISEDNAYTIGQTVREVSRKLQDALPKEEDEDDEAFPPCVSRTQKITVYDQ